MKIFPLVLLLALMVPNVARAQEHDPTKVLVRPPKPMVAFYGLMGLTGARYKGEQATPEEKEANNTGLVMGVSGHLGIMATHSFGVQFAGTYRPFQTAKRPGPTTIHTLSPELSFHFLSSKKREAGEGSFMFGTALVFPVGAASSSVPMAVAPFFGIEGMGIIRKSGSSAVGLGFDARIGYRFTTGQGAVPFIDGLYGELRSGIRLDFL